MLTRGGGFSPGGGGLPFEDSDDAIDKCKLFGCSFLVYLIPLFLLGVLKMCGGGVEGTYKVYVKQRDAESGKLEIVALSNSKNLEGSFYSHLFITTGTIDTVPYYFYYFKTSKGGYKLDWVKTRHTIVYEEERSDAYIADVGDVMCRVFIPIQNPAANSLPARCDDKWVIWKGYAIHVPKGTINRQIVLDLKDLK